MNDTAQCSEKNIVWCTAYTLQGTRAYSGLTSEKPCEWLNENFVGNSQVKYNLGVGYHITEADSHPYSPIY